MPENIKGSLACTDIHLSVFCSVIDHLHVENLILPDFYNCKIMQQSTWRARCWIKSPFQKTQLFIFSGTGGVLDIDLERPGIKNSHLWWTNIISNFDKYNVQFGQIQLEIWTNIIYNLQFWTYTISNLDKYNCKFGQIIIDSGGDNGDRISPDLASLCLCLLTRDSRWVVLVDKTITSSGR